MGSRHRSAGLILVLACAAVFARPVRADHDDWNDYGHHHHHDHGHWSGSVVIGAPWGVGPGYWYGSPYPYAYSYPYPYPYPYAYPYPYGREVQVVREPGPRIETPPGPPPVQYWYYCDPVREYYPYVQTCSAPWRQVPVEPPASR